jgi:hypothetical protein
MKRVPTLVGQANPAPGMKLVNTTIKVYTREDTAYYPCFSL